jgi:pantetheine-phosphate adenylyltransferase
VLARIVLMGCLRPVNLSAMRGVLDNFRPMVRGEVVGRGSKMKKAVYAGSFDPITNGHVWVVEQAVRLFDEVVVAIGENPDKQHTFSLPDRLSVLRSSLQSMAHVCVDTFESEFLVNYAKSVGAQYILRGIRDVAGYEFERGMRHINHDLQPEITTVFLMPPREIAELSSSLVKGLIGPAGWQDVVARYVPPPVYKLILAKHEDA